MLMYAFTPLPGSKLPKNGCGCLPMPPGLACFNQLGKFYFLHFKIPVIPSYKTGGGVIPVAKK